ncbi:LytR C-terminal domain-containing protein [Nocardioides caldifontis]|uniref:LytR C-terminal domain-containing protein n=1 Tax=Nocardioides caldifontis TaxID=2588938 RepID=UPI001EF15099|nr:LytR C-terminal domain-containing protein [Nocardioides caldifontis]
MAPAPRPRRRSTQVAAARAAYRARVEAARPPRPDQGFAMSSPVALMAAAAVALAGVGFLLTDTDEGPDTAVLASAPAPVEPTVTIEATKRKPAVKRSTVYIDVYNNSNVTGLAGSTAARIQSAGWQVVGSDNWYGTIPATTIYYPERLKAAAQLLSRDLGIERVLPAVDPMNRDRLTLILTADFA